MHVILLTVGLFISAIVVRSNIYGIQKEQIRVVILYEHVGTTYRYYQVWVKENA